jgi:hypothetical protein
METNQPIDQEYGAELFFSGNVQNRLHETAKWAKFISIVMFVFIGLMVLGGLSFGLVAGSFGSLSDELPFPIGMFSFVYLGLAALYFFPVLFLFRFASGAQDALRGQSQHHLENAFVNIHKHYRFLGILLVVLLGFYALFFVGLLVFGLTTVF